MNQKIRRTKSSIRTAKRIKQYISITQVVNYTFQLLAVII